MRTKLFENVYAVDLCTYIDDAKAIIISDLHLGFEENLEKQGVMVPRLQFKDIIKRLDWITSEVEVKMVVLNGDIKHEFGKVSKQEWREVRRLINYFKEKDIEIIAVKGNHDTIFGPIAKELDIVEMNELRHKGILVVHGDYVPKRLEKIIIMGHEHPAITVSEGAKREKYKCFVKTKFKSSTLLVQPSFNPLTQGTDISKEKLLSPLLNNFKNAEIFIVDDEKHEVLEFGKLSDIR